MRAHLHNLLALSLFLLPAGAHADTRTTSVSMTPTTPSPVPAGRGGLYTSSTDGKPRLVSTAGTEYPAGEARRIYVSAGAPGGAVLGDCWIDSTNNYLLYCKEGAGNLRQRPDLGVPGALGIPASPAVILAHADTAAGTKYLGGAGYGAASASQVVLFVAHSAQSIRYLACTAGTAPGGMMSDTITIQKSSDQGATWSDTASSCSLAGAGKTCYSAGVVLLAAYDWLAVKIVRDALSVSSGFSCSLVAN
jgi:hypothetical protein